MNNVHEAGQHGKFHLLFLEPMQHIKIISDLCPSDLILVCDEIGVNPLQKDCLIEKRVTNNVFSPFIDLLFIRYQCE